MLRPVSAPQPPALPPLLRDQRKTDRDNLKLLTVLHYVAAGFAVIGLLFLFMHWFMLSTMFGNPEFAKGAKGAPPPAEFFALFKWFYLFMGTMLVAGGLGNLLSAGFIKARRHRTFSLIIAGVNCMAFPIGTALGVYTFVVLLRDSVQELYEASAQPNP